MMTLKTFSLITLVTFLITSCNTNPSNQNSSDSNFSIFSSNSTKKVEFKDPKTGMVISSRDYPSEWNVSMNVIYKDNPDYPICSYQISGPDGLQLNNTVSDIFVYFDQQQANQMMANSGMKIKSPSNAQTIQMKEIAPKMKSMGFSFKGNRQIPEINQLIQNKAQAAGINNMTTEVHNSEWTNSQGQTALASITLMKFKTAPGSAGSNTTWTYGVDYMFSNTNSYEDALNQLIASVKTDETNPQWTSYQNQVAQRKTREMNQRNKNRMQQSQAAHQGRMNALQSNFNSHQKMMKGRSAAIDQSHQNFMNNFNSSPGYSSNSSSGHDAFINMINEEETIYNSSNGNSYQVEAGYDNYWMDNNSNAYYGTNDAFYNPNNDMYNDGTEWTIDK